MSQEMMCPGPIALSLAAALLVAAGCGRAGPPSPDELERLALEREREALAGYLADPALVPLEGVLVVVRQEVVRDVLAAGLPYERDVSDRFRVRLERAEVGFRSGLALVELGGRASLRSDPDAFAEITVLGAVEVIGIDAERSSLAMRVRVLGLRTEDVGVRGLSPPVERLVDRLASRQAEAFNDLLNRVEIPVRLRETLELPAVEEEEVTIPAASLRLGLSLLDVKVLADRLWVRVGVDVREAARLATTSGGASTPASGSGGAATSASGGAP